MIVKYDKYMDVIKITEALRTFPLFLSDRLKKVLANIDHDIASELLALHSDLDSRVPKTFIDIHEEKSNFFTFSQPNKAIITLGLNLTTDDEIEANKDEILAKYNSMGDEVYKKFRSEVRIGSLIRDIFRDKFPESIPGGQNKKDIESFVNLYKAEYSEDEKFKLFDIVKGEQISYYYNRAKYCEGGGSLGGSCMQSVPAYYFDIYTKNPEKVSMLIMYSDDTKNKIKGRAIVWKLDSPRGRTFMDRVYTNDYSDEQIFINYAIKNNWIYKESQSMGSDVELIDVTINDEPREIDMVIDLASRRYDSFPYCDTMTFMNTYNNTLSNSDEHDPSRILIDTDGGYENYDESEYQSDDVYSDYNGENIDRDDAKWCELGQDWVRSNQAVRIFNTGPVTYAIPDYPGVVKQTVTVNGEIKIKHFMEKDCVWSDFLNTFLYKSSAINVWKDKEKTNWILEYKKRKDETFYEIDGENYAKELVDTETMTLK